MSTMKRMSRVLSIAAAMVFAAAAFAQDKRPGYGAPVNLATAKKMAAGALAECQKNQWNVAVAVVDNHGLLIYFERLDDTQTASSQIALDKARAAAMYRRPTRAFADAIAKAGPAVMTLPGVIASPGGRFSSAAGSSAASGSAASPETRTSNARKRELPRCKPILHAQNRRGCGPVCSLQELEP